MLLTYDLMEKFTEILMENQQTDSNGNGNIYTDNLTPLSEKIILRLFSEMDQATRYVNSHFREDDIIFREKTHKDHQMIGDFLSENEYLNLEMRSFIGNTDYKIIEYRHRELLYTFIDYSESHGRDKEKEKEKDAIDDIKNLLTITIFLQKYRRSSCKIRNLSTYIFLTPFQKSYPCSKGAIISGEHINSGYTIPCQTSSKIFLWRKEEYFKVYIHEFMHAMGIDFATMNIAPLQTLMSRIFPNIESEFCMFESYADIWALILNNILYVSRLSRSRMKRLDMFQNLYHMDKLWTVFQSVKVLKNYGLGDYRDYIHHGENDCGENDWGRGEQVLEETNTFAYFIGKAILMVSIDDFLEFCYRHNTMIITFSRENLDSRFLEFIESHYRSHSLVGLFELFERIYAGIDKKSYMWKTMRWSLLEWN